MSVLTVVPGNSRAQAYGIALGLLAGLAILTVSVPGRWAQGAVETATFALAAAWLIAAWPPARPRLNPAGWMLLAAAGWPLLQLAAGRTVYREATWTAALEWFARLVWFQLAAEIFAADHLRRHFRRAISYAGLVFAVVSTLACFSAGGRIFWLFPTPYKDQVLGPFVNRDHYAALMELLIPVAVYEAVCGVRARRVHVLAAAAMFGSVIAGASRAGAVIAALELAAMSLLLYRRDRARARVPVLAAVLGCCATLATVAGWGPLWRRWHEPDPFRLRAELLRSAVHMIQDRPMAGFGLGTFETVYPAYALFDNGLRVDHAHNDWAEWAAEGGLLFAALLLAITFYAVSRLKRAPWGLGILAVFLHGAVDFPLHKPALAGVVFLLLGVVSSACRAAGSARPGMTPARLRGATGSAGHGGPANVPTPLP